MKAKEMTDEELIRWVAEMLAYLKEINKVNK